MAENFANSILEWVTHSNGSKDFTSIGPEIDGV
jgi:hypothetical protein